MNVHGHAQPRPLWDLTICPHRCPKEIKMPVEVRGCGEIEGESRNEMVLLGDAFFDEIVHL